MSDGHGNADSARDAGPSGRSAATPHPLVRPATPADVPAIWRLIGDLARYERLEASYTGSAERLAAHLFGDRWPRIEALVAGSEGELVGYAIYYGVFSTFWTLPMLWLEDLYVDSSHRGQGLGRALLGAVARVATERGCARLNWAVLDWNTPSIEFYERLGARRQGGWYGYELSGDALRRLSAEPVAGTSHR